MRSMAFRVLTLLLLIIFSYRKISKYSFVVKKGAPQFRKVGEHEHDQELAAFIENDNRTASCGNGVVMIDSYGRFTTTEFMDSTRGGNDSTPQLRRSQSAVPLPYNLRRSAITLFMWTRSLKIETLPLPFGRRVFASWSSSSRMPRGGFSAMRSTVNNSRG